MNEHNATEQAYKHGYEKGRAEAIDLINRQKAEIEKVKPIHNSFERELECAKQEAIKEFAERLKEQKYQSSDWSRGEHPFVVEESDIDELVQEMVGEEDG